MGVNWEERVDSLASGQNEFISYEEFVRGRETRLYPWALQYDSMKIIPSPSPVYQTPSVEALLTRSGSDWDSMPFFDKWVVAMYGEGVAKKFGSIDPVDSTLIPLGMINVFTQSRMKWDQ